MAVHPEHTLLRRLCRLTALALLIALLAGGPGAAPAIAVPQDAREKQGAGAPSRLEQAREESARHERPRAHFSDPAFALTITPTEVLASNGAEITLTVTLRQAVDRGTLQVTLPPVWVGRAGVSDLPYARVPATGPASTARAGTRRSDRTIRFRFQDGREGDTARFSLQDIGIPAGSYELPYRWTQPGVREARASATVIFFAPTREQQHTEGQEDEEPEPAWARLANPGLESNVSNDNIAESETFLTVVPGDRRRFVVGANTDGSFGAFITNDGGATYSRAVLPSVVDAPNEATPEASDLCCDPMSAADPAGNLWYGGLTQANGPDVPSRIVLNRVAPGQASFQPMSVGLPERGRGGTQDKPMMTIDNAPSSPAFGRLYVVWNEPSVGGVNIVISQCDTRPGGTPNAANCDNADRWTRPVSVTPAEGSYIYADVAVSPDGRINVVWWDYSGTNAIRGDTCAPATQDCASAAGWGTPQTVASLDASDGRPVPFQCPILAQPGGRAAPSPQVDVDRSGGVHNRRVYVTWGDLRAGSGTTRCTDAEAPAGAPSATHLTWDSFVASAPDTLPAVAAAPATSPITRLLTDGEGGGQASSDDWFPWLAVDQTTGQAWADFYSTRDDPTRRTTNFYVRTVTPGSGGHTLGALTRVSSAPSDFSGNLCCAFGNDYGDYTGLDATGGLAYPVWTDKRAGLDGEAFTRVANGVSLVAAALAFDDSTAAGGDADGVLEPGESFRLTQRVTNNGTADATSVRATLTESDPSLTLSTATSDYADLPVDATQPNATPFTGTLGAGATCTAPLVMTLQLSTAQGAFSIPITVPASSPCPAPAPPPAPAPVPVPAPVVTPVPPTLRPPGSQPPRAGFARSPKTVRVSRTRRLRYSFTVTPFTAGKVRFTTAQRIRVGSRRRTVSLGSRAFTSPAGGTVRVQLRLSRANLAILRQRRSLRLRVRVTLGTRAFTTILTLRPPR